MTELKVLISDGFAFANDQVSIAIVLQHNQDERLVLHVNEEGYTSWSPVENYVIGKPTITLNNDVARALLDSLLRHYQGASDMQTVRQDLLHERDRVDKLIGATIDLAEKALDSALGN